MMQTITRTLIAGGFVAALMVLGTGVATASTDPNFQPGPDYSNFQPGPDYSNFQPGAAPGTADLVDDNVGRVLSGLLGGRG